MLQEELPAQDKMKIGGHRGFMPYMAVAQGIAASLSGPGKTAVCHQNTFSVTCSPNPVSPCFLRACLGLCIQIVLRRQLWCSCFDTVILLIAYILT